MALRDKVLLSPTMSAAQSGSFGVDKRRVTVYVYGSLFVGGEYADLERQDPTGAWQTVWDSNGQIRLHANRPGVDIIGGGTYRISKSGSTGTIGVAFVEGPA